MNVADERKAQSINKMYPKFKEAYDQAMEANQGMIDRILDSTMKVKDEDGKVQYPHYVIGVAVKIWNVPMTQKLSYLGWSHATYRERTRFVSFPDVSSREGLKYRRDPLRPGASAYLNKINYYLDLLDHPTWDKLPPAPVKKWTRQNPNPSKNETVEKPISSKTDAVKNESPQNSDVF